MPIEQALGDTEHNQPVTSNSSHRSASPSGGQGCLIIVCGLPGSGKTTEAKRLSLQRPGVRFAPDEWMNALGVNLWDSAMRQRIESLQWVMAKELLRLGTTVIVEWGTWGRDERDSLRTQARELGASVELHHLDVPLDELWRRIQARNAETPPVERSDVEDWAHTFQAPDEAELRQYDRNLHQSMER